MKTSDADLIKKLNGLSERDRANLLEFLGRYPEMKEGTEDLRNFLEASIHLHKNPGNGSQH